MNTAHLHITIVHIPIVLTPLALILLTIAHLKGSLGLAKVALWIGVFASVFAIVAFLFGEPAEEIVEHLAGISKHTIEEHEEAAEIALWCSATSGIFSLVSIVLIFLGSRVQRLALALTSIVMAFTSASLVYTASQGGKIRHPEAFSAAQNPNEPPREAHDDD